MNAKRITPLLIASLLTLLFSCDDQTDLPESLQDILERQGVSTSGGPGTGTGSVGSSTGISYSGPYAANVKLLLSKVSGWKTFSCLTCSDGVPPKVNINSNCQRDAYVAAAVSYAWAAENYYRLGRTTDATTQATSMNTNLQYARNLCSNSISVGGSSCLTLTIFPC